MKRPAIILALAASVVVISNTPALAQWSLGPVVPHSQTGTIGDSVLRPFLVAGEVAVIEETWYALSITWTKMRQMPSGSWCREAPFMEFVVRTHEYRDVNQDGYDDLVVTRFTGPVTDPVGPSPAETYVLYGADWTLCRW